VWWVPLTSSSIAALTGVGVAVLDQSSAPKECKGNPNSMREQLSLKTNQGESKVNI
jgi:type 1 fimbria pilin